jgi:hypothetical protein
MVKIDTNPPDFEEYKQTQEDEHFENIAKSHRLEPSWSLEELLEADLNEEFIVDQVLVENQPFVVAGEFKTLKTTLLIMMALSLCSGAKFLGRYEVKKKKRVLFCSAESGKKKIRTTIYAVAKQMGISIAELRDSGSLSFSWWVPKVSSMEVMDYFKNEVTKSQAEVVFIDPLYQALDDQQASMILNGQQLAALCNFIKDAGATPVCCDHVKRSSLNTKNREPLELDDISGAGKAEYFRQWMLVSRRKKFEPEENKKPHDLWLSIGGSEGHSGQLALDVVETFDDQGHMTIEVATQQRSEMIQQRQESTKSKKEESKEKALKEKLDRVLGYFTSNPNKLIVNADVKALMNCNSDSAKAILFHLVEKNLIVRHPFLVRRGTNSCEAFHLPGAQIELEGQGGQNEVVPLSPSIVSDGAKSGGLEGQGQTPIGGCPSVPLSVTKNPILKKKKNQPIRTKK